MKLTTSKGLTYDVEWIDGPTMISGTVILHMRDDRRIPEIAAEFDSLEWLKRESETQGNKEWTGYSAIQRISQTDGFVQIALAKEN
jgi:hypothetical protein